MATNKIQTGLRLNETIYDKLKVLSDRENRSLNNLIEHILQLHLVDYERTHGAIVLPEQ